MDITRMFLALSLIIPLVSEACTTEVHLASSHDTSGKWDNSQFNESNLGLGRECKGYQAGFYKNSDSRLSVYAGRVFRLNPYTGIKLGIVSGYGPPTAFLGGYIRFLGNELTIIPPSRLSPLTVGYSLRF